MLRSTMCIDIHISQVLTSQYMYFIAYIHRHVYVRVRRNVYKYSKCTEREDRFGKNRWEKKRK